jgi:N-acetylmuramoyl-L-alanine amidase
VKKYVMGLTMALMFIFLVGINTIAAGDFKFFVETGGKIVDVSNALVNVMVEGVILKTNEIPGIALEHRTLVPVREMFEMEGIAANVVWDNSDRSITITKDGTIIRLVIGSYTAIVDGKAIPMDACPRLVRDVTKPNAKTMIPIRFVAETLGYNVEWNANSSLAKLTLTGNSLMNEPVEWNNTSGINLESLLTVTGMKLSETAGETSLLLTGTNNLDYNIQMLQNPNRLVVDIVGAATSLGYKEQAVNGRVVYSIRTAPYENNFVRVVLDLKTEVVYKVEENENLVLLTISPKDNQTPATPKKPVIVIDAGHGATDPGAMSKGIKEKDLNLNMLLALKRRFDLRDDIIVYYTRTTDIYPTLKQRADLATRVNADLFLSIHNNSVWNTAVSGTETLYKPGVAGSYEFAAICQKYLINTLGLKNRGLVKRDDLYILNHLPIPVALVEIGFMSNTGDLSRLTDYYFVENVADALEKAIDEAFQK